MVKGKCALCPMGGAGDALGGYKVRIHYNEYIMNYMYIYLYCCTM